MTMERYVLAELRPVLAARWDDVVRTTTSWAHSDYCAGEISADLRPAIEEARFPEALSYPSFEFCGRMCRVPWTTLVLETELARREACAMQLLCACALINWTDLSEKNQWEDGDPLPHFALAVSSRSVSEACARAALGCLVEVAVTRTNEDEYPSLWNRLAIAVAAEGCAAIEREAATDTTLRRASAGVVGHVPGRIREMLATAPPGPLLTHLTDLLRGAP